MPEFGAVFSLDNIDGVSAMRITGANDRDDFGRASAGVGDVNGDGFADLVFGAERYDGEGSNIGAAYVVFGGTHLAELDAANGAVDGQIDINDLDGTNGFQILGDADNGSVGSSVSFAGDVDGDGFDDIVIGADGGGGGNGSGRAAIIFGGSTLAPVVSFTPVGGTGFVFEGIGTNTIENFGYSVGGGGDFDGDGFDDVLIGAFRADPLSGAGNGNEGAVFLVRGGDANLQDLDQDDGSGGGTIEITSLDDPGEGAVFVGEDARTGAELGHSVHFAGDVNGDGFDDLIMGSPNADPASGAANESEGAAYIVFGRADLETLDLPEEVTFSSGVSSVEIRGVDPSDTFGDWVSGGGDVNGDGLDDVLIAAPRADSLGANSSGSAYVIFGRSQWGPAFDPDTLDGSNGFRMDGLRQADYTGISVSMAGDVNGDGFEDVAVAAHFFDQIGYNSTGAVFVVFGKADGFDPVIELGALDGNDGFRIDGPSQNGAILGRGMSGPAGDVNGDGFDDLVLGVYREDTVLGEIDHGAGYIVFGQMAQTSVTRIGTEQAQTQNGGIGDDFIDGRDGNDSLIGHAGDDTILGGAGNDLISLGEGDDDARGGSGNDRFFLNLGLNSIHGNSGIDALDLGEFETAQTLRLFDASFQAGGETTTFASIENALGTMDGDAITGNSKDNLLIGRGGDDTLRGGAGDDQLFGNAGQDRLFGGSGEDTFGYNNIFDSPVGPGNRDFIADFVVGEDVIRLTNIDADTGTGGNQAFTFIGFSAFSGTAGELRISRSVANDLTLVRGDVDGDGVQDFDLEVSGAPILSAGDFIL
ncbi:MAG: hypothetical protein AAF415_05200 [Pseudomonadota bacterium]